jgi:hypothetical protein
MPSPTAEERARQLLHRRRLIRRCLALPGLNDAERAGWLAELTRTEAELRRLAAGGEEIAGLIDGDDDRDGGAAGA